MTDSTKIKDYIDAVAVGRIAEMIGAADPSFDVQAFVTAGCAGLEELELMERVRHLAAALRWHLARDYEVALRTLVAALPPLNEETQEVAFAFDVWPFCQFVADYGLLHPEPSLDALAEMTTRSSAEFAIRPFIAEHLATTFERLRGWASDESFHLRRLASEGTRPRLPWGRHLEVLIEDPHLALELLELLKDDPVLTVRRSVANHLNDIAKDHPAVVVETCRRWMTGASPERQWVIKQALRTLVKKGDPEALELLGFAPAQVEVERFLLSPEVLSIGETLRIELSLWSRSEAPQGVVIDLILFFRKARGELKPKVFKWKTTTLEAGGALLLAKEIPLLPRSTRVLYPGRHDVELQINGASMGRVGFELRAPE